MNNVDHAREMYRQKSFAKWLLSVLEEENAAVVDVYDNNSRGGYYSRMLKYLIHNQLEKACEEAQNNGKLVMLFCKLLRFAIPKMMLLMKPYLGAITYFCD